MSHEDILEGLAALIADHVVQRIGKSQPAPVANKRALSRREAEKAMGIGRSKLQELIASGEIKTVKDNPRLVPMSEVERYCQPRRQKPRRRATPVAVPTGGTTDPERARQMLAEMNRRSR